MPRLKVLIAAILSLFALLILWSFDWGQTESAQEQKAFTEEMTEAKRIVDKAYVQKYRAYQTELSQALNAYFEKAVAAGDIVGAGVGIVHGDSIVIATGFGKRSVDGNDLVDGETVFRLGSLSKGFAGVLAAGLTHEGKLRWEDKVSDYLPDFQLGDANHTAKVTLANILSHTSGAPYHSFTNLVEAGLPLQEIAGRFQEVMPISEPGSLYSYQNALFALGGEVMRKVTGQKVARTLQTKLFEPLGMQTVSMDYNALTRSDNVAMPHVRTRNGWRHTRLTDHYDNAILAGGINASSLDMGKWMRFLLGHNPEVMPKPVIEGAFRPFVEIKGGHKYYHRWPGHISSHYGFGWRIHKFSEEGDPKEKTVWHHGGSVNNFRNEIAVYPEADLGICVLLNGNFRVARTVIPDLYEMVKALPFPEPAKIELPGLPDMVSTQ